MRFTIILTLALLLIASTAQAAILQTGGFVSARNEQAGVTSGIAVGTMFHLPTIANWTPRYGEFAFEASGEGATESLTRLGAHWALLTYERMDFTFGGGAVVRALGVQATDVGAFGSVSAIFKNGAGESKYGAGLYVNSDLANPRPWLTGKVFYVQGFEWPF